MDIYIVRHGIAEEATRGMSDEKRALTSEGRKKMKEAAAGFANLELGVSRVFASPLVRAQQTAEILAAPLKLKVEEMPELAPGHSPSEVLRALQEHRSVKGVMLVGHQPNCSDLTSYLLGGNSIVNVEFKKGAICVIYSENLSAGDGILLAHYPPSALRSLE